MTLLDAMPPGAIVARVFFLATGITGLWVGLSIRHESTRVIHRTASRH